MDAIIGHEAIRRELSALSASTEPPHALLFAGPEGTGRALLALEYAKLLNCERAPWAAQGSMALLETPAGPAELPCGACRSCRLIAGGSHPDVVTLAPGDTLCRPRSSDASHEKHPQSRDIRICQVRGAIDLVSRYPFEAAYRLLIIDPADRFGRDAAHTILKTLEEPPGHSVFALVTAAPEAILETILSRCRRIDVRPVPRETIEHALIGRGIAPAAARIAAEACRGRPGRALQFAASPDLMGDRERLLDRCRRLANAPLQERFRHAEDLTERWRRDRAQVGAELDVWEAFWEGELRAGASVRAGDAPGSPAGVLHGDDLRQALSALEAVRRVRDDLQAQVMVRAAFELMLLSFPRRTLAGVPEGKTVTHA
ncbi:MAG: hypothetical protein HYX53_14550 [Chloroflexi bacterium]|nr:hypothetical protein [Chloroflexota bacterium]